MFKPNFSGHNIIGEHCPRMPPLVMRLPVKQKFRSWMKILLHCLFGSTQVSQMTYEPMHSAQAQSVRVTKQYILVLLLTIVATRNITKSEDKCIF